MNENEPERRGWDYRRIWKDLGPEGRRRVPGLLALFFLLLAVKFSGRTRGRRPPEEIVILTLSGDSPGATKFQEGRRPDSVHLDFSGSAARLDQVGKAPGTGISLWPRLRGRWVWENDRRLTFTPAEDWGVGEAYRVRLDPKLFPSHVKLDTYEYRFQSAPFTAELVESRFYIDPKDPRVKQVVATVKFSHIVDTVEFEKRISLSYEEPARKLIPAVKRRLAFTVSYDKFMGEAYIRSKSIAIPQEPAWTTLSVAPGLKAARGGAASARELAETVRVPGMYEFFHVTGAETAIARNERYEPEQVLVLQTTTEVLETEMNKAVAAWILPKDKPADGHHKAVPNYEWPAERVGPEILALSTAAVLEPIPAELECTTVHTFRYKGPPGRYLLIQVRKGVRAYGGYVLAEPFAQTAQIPQYPRELKIMHDGAILDAAGEHKLSIFSLELEGLRFELGRVLPAEINHLATQADGDFAHPMFHNYRFGEDDISERFEETRPLHKGEPGKSQYTAFDFTKYLQTGRRGLFFFRVEEWDPKEKRSGELSDARLILVTDLGLVVKDNADGSHDVFVQSLSSGRPAAGARVEVIGKNGLAAVTVIASEDGRAHFPDLSGFSRERTPTVWAAKRGDDLSFLPFNRADRRIDFSRFDVGGVQTAGRGGTLEAFVFSDRGIYRPGDLFHSAFLVRALDWSRTPVGLPLEVSVTDPRGLEVQKTKVALSTAAFEEVSYKTDENQPTGSYQIGVYIVRDGKRSSLLGSTSVRVEEFLPDRMRISSRFSEQRAQGWVHPDKLKAEVSLNNLFGTPAEDRRVRARLALSPSAPEFSGLPGFQFFDPALAKKGFSDSLSDARTDAKGEASFDLDLGRFSAGTYRLLFTAEGYEAEGGRGVVSESSVLVSPRDYLVGFKADGDLSYVSHESTRTIELVAVGPDAKPIAVSGLKALLVEERFVSVLTKQNDGTYRYQSVRKQSTLKTWPLNLPAKRFKVALPTNAAGDFALVVRDELDAELSRAPFTVIGRANLTRNLERNAELQVRLNKGDYAPGENIELSIRAPYVGAGLITIERDRVFTHRWFKTDTTASVQTIRVPEAVEGNAYVSVCFLRSPGSKEIFMSPLSYAAVPFTVSLKRRTLPLELEAPARALPGEKIRLRFRTDRPAKIAVYAVDEGILQVAGYQTPDPLAAFFKKRALEVRTSQLLDLLLPEFSTMLSAMAPGGDKGREAIGKNLNPFKRKRDKPAAFWSGIVNSGPQWREVVYEVPDTFNGTLRVMAVAATPGALGVAERKSLVRGPFVLSPNAPTFAAPGDEFVVSVGVANGVESSGPDAKVSVSLKASGHFQLLEGAPKTLAIGEGREGQASFRLRALPALGSGRLTFTAAVGSQTSRQSVDLSVRPPVPHRADVETGSLAAGEDASIKTPRRMYPAYRKLEAAVSTLPLDMARGLIRYLVSYPYGCTEQLVSQAFPALILRHRPEFGYAPKQVEAILAEALRVLRSRQNAEGAFGFWSANSFASDFQAVYAMHFLTEAKDMGYAVPADLVKNGSSFLNALSAGRPGKHVAPRLRAYALYILTRNGQITTSALETLRQELDAAGDKSWRQDLTGAYMAGSYSLLHLDAQAEELIRESKFGAVGPKDYDYEMFYDGLVHDSQLLYILSRSFPNRLKALKAEPIERIVDSLRNGNYNTLSSAYAIMALEAYVEIEGDVTPDKARVFENLESGGERPVLVPAGLFPVAEFSPQASTLNIEDTGKGRLFYQVTTSGFDLRLPTVEIKQGIEVQREYRDLRGQPVTKAGLGDELTVHFKIRAVGRDYVPNIAVVDLLPAGFEVVEDRRAPPPEAGPAPVVVPFAPAASENSGDCEGDCGEGEADSAPAPAAPGTARTSLEGGWTPQYVDIREDRVVLFGSATSAVQDYVYRIKATNRGTFVTPPTYAESMYDRTVLARGLPAQMTVE